MRSKIALETELPELSFGTMCDTSPLIGAACRKTWSAGSGSPQSTVADCDAQDAGDIGLAIARNGFGDDVASLIPNFSDGQVQHLCLTHYSFLAVGDVLHREHSATVP